MINSRALLVSDDRPTGQIWAHGLGQKGLEVVLVGTAEETLKSWATETFDLVVIDVYTPRLDGIDLTRQLRTVAVNPILFLTYNTAEPHILEAYEAGVDECITKPISPPLFLAKVTAWLRRSWTVPAEALDNLEVGPFRLDPASRQLVQADQDSIKLTNLEFRLLHLLMSHQGQVLDTELIVDRVWGHSGDGDNTLLKNVVYRLRRKLEPNPSQPRYLQTMAGEGYSFGPH
ncbi:MAG: response regulator transcription factor [Anaerolineae bacterium]|nr:response regulator transcription factor [Anaerolineae bacterium]